MEPTDSVRTYETASPKGANKYPPWS